MEWENCRTCFSALCNVIYGMEGEGLEWMTSLEKIQKQLTLMSTKLVHYESEVDNDNSSSYRTPRAFQDDIYLIITLGNSSTFTEAVRTIQYQYFPRDFASNSHFEYQYDRIQHARKKLRTEACENGMTNRWQKESFVARYNRQKMKKIQDKTVVEALSDPTTIMENILF